MVASAREIAAILRAKDDVTAALKKIREEIDAVPAFELREHRTDHGYDVRGRYGSPDAARAERDRLVAEDRARMGRYQIHYDQHGTPDSPAPPPIMAEEMPAPQKATQKR